MNMPRPALSFAARFWTGVVIACVVSSCTNRDRSGAGESGEAARQVAFQPLEIGGKVPAYKLASLNGDTISLGSGAQTTILNVWATWCTSCREEMSDLETLHHELSGHGVRVAGVSVDRASGARVRQFVDRERLTFTVAHDPAQRVQQLYHIVGVPETLVIGADGRLLLRWVGNVHPVLDSVRRVALAGSLTR